MKALGLTCFFMGPQKSSSPRETQKALPPRKAGFFHSFQTGLALWENGDSEASIHAFRGRPAFPEEVRIASGLPVIHP